MDYLKVSEVALLKGCSLQYIQKRIKDGKLAAVELPNAANNRKEYGVPVEALPEQLKTKYYTRKRNELGLQPIEKTVKIAHKKCLNAVKKPLEEYTEDERQQIKLWTDIIREWLRLRDAAERKTDVDPLYVAKCKLDHPDLTISEDILYRKYNAYRNNDLDALLGKRGG